MKKNFIATLIFLIAVVLVSFLVFKKDATAPTTGESLDVLTAQDGLPTPTLEESATFDPTTQATLAGVPIMVAMADTDETRDRGLSNLESIPDETGLFYVFDAPDQLSYWMKDMKFSTDVIWFDSSYKVVNIRKNISPTTYPEIFTTENPAQFMLEVPADFVTKHNIKVGDRISF